MKVKGEIVRKWARERRGGQTTLFGNQTQKRSCPVALRCCLALPWVALLPCPALPCIAFLLQKLHENKLTIRGHFGSRCTLAESVVKVSIR